MTRYICSGCGYTSGSRERVARHIKRTHKQTENERAADKYGNLPQTDANRARIISHEPETPERHPVMDLVQSLKRLIRRER